MSVSVNLTIKRVFYGETLNYTVGIAESLDLYVLEATDIQGFIMGIPGQTSAENPAKAVFGISKEEFDLKDTDTAKLDDLAFTLMHELPGDRIIAESNLRKNGRTETIDSGKYASEKKVELECKKIRILAESAERAKKLISAMFKNEEGYVLYVKGAGNRLPAIDNIGAVQIFTKEEYAENLTEKVSETPLEILKLDKNGLSALFHNLFRYGILKIKVDPLLKEGGEIERDEVANLGGLKRYQLLNSKVCSLMIRYLQAKQLLDKTSANLNSATLWSAFCKEFPKSLFFVPMCFEDEIGKAKDENEMYFTENAVKVMNETKPAILYMEKYKITNGGGRTMRFITLKNKAAGEEKIFFPVFTDIGELKAVFGDKARICMISYSDLRDKYKSCFAVVVNPASLNFIITDKGMENIEQEKEGPVKVYRLDPNAKSEEIFKE